MGKIGKWRVLSSEYISRDPWFTVRRERVELPNGCIIPSYYILEYPAWVCVLALTKDGRMIIECQYRHGIGQAAYELCAGVAEPIDNTFMDAAKRELLEETGYGNGEWQPLMAISANPATHTNLTYCFLALGVEKIDDQHLELTEELTVELVAPQKVREYLETGKVYQAIHAAVLWKYFAMKAEQSL